MKKSASYHYVSMRQWRCINDGFYPSGRVVEVHLRSQASPTSHTIPRI